MTFTQESYDALRAEKDHPIRSGDVWAAGCQNAAHELFGTAMDALKLEGVSEQVIALVAAECEVRIVIGEVTEREQLGYENGHINGLSSARRKLVRLFATKVLPIMSDDRAEVTRIAEIAGVHMPARFTDPVVLPGAPTEGKEKSIAKAQQRQEAARHAWKCPYDVKADLPDYCFIIGKVGAPGHTVAGIKPKKSALSRFAEERHAPKTGKEKRQAKRAQNERRVRSSERIMQQASKAEARAERDTTK